MLAKPVKHYLFSVILACLTVTVRAQSAQDILDRYMHAVSNGDIEKWSKLKSAYIESVGSFDTGLAFGSTPNLVNAKIHKHKTYRVWPDLSYSEMWEDSVVVIRTYGTPKGNFLVMGRGEPMPTSPGPYERTFEFMPVTISRAVKKAKAVTLKGRVELEGKPCYEIEVVTKQLTWKLYFDEVTYLLNFWANSPDGDFNSLTSTFNYKEINGLNFSMSEKKSRNGVVFFWSEITLLELDKEIDPKIFEYRSN